MSETSTVKKILSAMDIHMIMDNYLLYNKQPTCGCKVKRNVFSRKRDIHVCDRHWLAVRDCTLREFSKAYIGDWDSTDENR